MKTLQLTPHIQITNGKMFDCIGHDQNFKPVFYAPINDMDGDSAMNALTHYFSHSNAAHLMLISEFMSDDTFIETMNAIEAKAKIEARSFYYANAINCNGYKFTYLPA